MSLIEDFSPIHQGDTGAMVAPQFSHADGSFVSLANCTISMKMLNIDTGTVKTCIGPPGNTTNGWIIDDASSGTAHYQFEAADVDTPGIWKLFIVVTLNGRPIHADERLLEIKVAP